MEQRCVTTDVIEGELIQLQDRMEHCEIYSRCENLILRGIEEGSAEHYYSLPSVFVYPVCNVFVFS